jgi:hypothetical protein
MEQWQFLIQKQGDRTWHPLESLTVEIMEGRYRVVARSHRVNTDVDVRITHSSPPEVSPQKRVYKRSRRTNDDGSMAVIPFTYFQPGLWELRCSGDLMSDVFGNSWQYLVNLKVLPQKLETTANPNLPQSEEKDQNNQITDSEPGINPVLSPVTVAKSNLPIPPAPPNLVPVAIDSVNPVNELVSPAVVHTVDVTSDISVNTVESEEQRSREQRKVCGDGFRPQNFSRQGAGSREQRKVCGEGFLPQNFSRQ